LERKKALRRAQGCSHVCGVQKESLAKATQNLKQKGGEDLPMRRVPAPEYRKLKHEPFRSGEQDWTVTRPKSLGRRGESHKSHRENTCKRPPWKEQIFRFSIGGAKTKKNTKKKNKEKKKKKKKKKKKNKKKKKKKNKKETSKKKKKEKKKKKKKKTQKKKKKKKKGGWCCGRDGGPQWKKGVTKEILKQRRGNRGGMISGKDYA